MSDHIARRDSTQLNKTVLLSRVVEVITSPDATQLNKTVLLSWVASGDVIIALDYVVIVARFKIFYEARDVNNLRSFSLTK